MLEPNKALEVFFSYSHKDQDLRDQLETHLSLLKNQGVVSGWHDRKVIAGTEWAGEIEAHLNTAQIILLLISADFLASSYCYGIEVMRAMDRHNAGEARVIPIILRACDWHNAPFGKLQALPTDGKPISGRSWRNRDEAFLNATQGIRKIINLIRDTAKHAQPSQYLRNNLSFSSLTTPVRITPKYHILFVDDENVKLDEYRNFMSSKSKYFYCTYLGDGREAIAFIERIHVDILFLDLLMARVGGLLVIEQLRERGYDLPIIVVSGAIPSMKEAVSLGANAFVWRGEWKRDLRGILFDYLVYKGEMTANIRTQVNLPNIRWESNPR